VYYQSHIWCTFPCILIKGVNHNQTVIEAYCDLDVIVLPLVLYRRRLLLTLPVFCNTDCFFLRIVFFFNLYRSRVRMVVNNVMNFASMFFNAYSCLPRIRLGLSIFGINVFCYSQKTNAHLGKRGIKCCS